MHRVLIGLGGNIGDADTREATLRQAWGDVVRLLGLRGARLSPIYVSRPAEGVGGGRFSNAVGVGWCRLPAAAVLEGTQRIERAWGRVPRRGAAPEPRVLDLDVLDVGGVQRASDSLTLPHPRLGQRDFVLTPLRDVAAEFVDAGSGRTLDALIAALAPSARTLESP